MHFKLEGLGFWFIVIIIIDKTIIIIVSIFYIKYVGYNSNIFPFITNVIDITKILITGIWNIQFLYKTTHNKLLTVFGLNIHNIWVLLITFTKWWKFCFEKQASNLFEIYSSQSFIKIIRSIKMCTSFNIW